MTENEATRLRVGTEPAFPTHALKAPTLREIATLTGSASRALEVAGEAGQR